METITARYAELSGTHYEIGQKLGRFAAGIPQLAAVLSTAPEDFSAEEFSYAESLFAQWCPGLNEEIQGFAGTLGISPMQVSYYAMTSLKPACSQIAVLPGLAANGHVLLARSYEFSHLYEDFALVRTCARGKYAHVGTSVLQFGRDEGLNECGLAVSMGSCGMPVGALAFMRKPALRGLQFWAVIRTLLENCKDVREALETIKEMPVAYNINLMLADRSGRAALFETLDGRKAVKTIDGGSGPQYLHATNHAHLPELMPYEPHAMSNSIVRYEAIQQYLKNAAAVSADDLKALLLAAYPDGLCIRDYKSFFGTTKSIVMDANDGRVDLCWGGLAGNGWRSFYVARPQEESAIAAQIQQEDCPPSFYEFA